MHFKILGIEGATSLELVNTATKHLSLEELKACLVKTKLNQEQMKQILMNHGVSASEAEKMAAVLAVSQAEMAATASTGALTTATGGLSAAFRGLTVAMASNPIGAIAVAAATVIGVVSTAVTVFSNWSNSIEDVKDKANELKNDFDNKSNEISENTEKLKSLKSEFEKLSKGVSDYGENISLTGDEYERYKEIVQTILGISPSLIEGYDKEGTALANKNGLLEKSIALMEEEQRLEKEKLTRTDNLNKLFNASKEDIKIARNDVNKIIRPDDISYTRIKTVIDGKEYGTVNDSILDFIQAIIGEDKDFSGNIADFIVKHYDEIYKHLNEIVDKSQQGIIDKIDDDNYSEIIAFTESQAESFRNYLLQFKDYIDTQDEVNSEFNSYLQLIPESMREYSGLNDSSKTFISEWIKKNFTIDENTTEQDIKDFSSKIRKFTKQIADDKDLQSLFDFGAELITDTDNESLSVEAYQNKVKEFIDKVNNLNDEDTKLYIKTVFGFEENDDDLAKDVSDKIKRVQNILVDADDDKVSGLSMQELNIAYNISAEEGSLTFDELQDKIKETAQKSKESAFELSEAQTKQIKQINSDYDKLNKVYNDLFSKKEHSEIESDVWELVSSFPELYQYIDWTDEKFGNLAEGIDKVISGLSTDLVAELEAIDPSKLSDDGKKALQSIIDVMKMMHPTLKTTVNLIEDIQKAIKGVSSSISTLIGFTKEISSDGALSLSSIDTIMTDDTYKSLRPYINDMEGMQTAITELVAKQKDAYEDLYNAEMYENDYEAYHKAVQEKEKDNENLLGDSIKQIQDEIKYFNDFYGIDITNWDNLSEIKKAALQNTNAELLSKQGKLIKDFGQLYNDDITNFANATKAKAEIQKHFEESQVYSKINSMIDNDPSSITAYDKNTGKITGRYASQKTQAKITDLLSTYGLTYSDYANYRDHGQFTRSGNAALEKVLDELIKPYKITTNTWNKLTGNTKSTGNSSDSGTGNSSDSGLDTSTTETGKVFDWIERRLKKFANNTKQVFSKIGDYITFKGKNKQISKSINAIEKEISFNKNAYGYYMNEANKVGLGSYWKKAVREGGRNLSEIKNADLKEKIENYQELYDKAISCRDAVSDLKETEKEYIRQRLDNIETYYENRINYINADSDYYNNLDKDTRSINKNYKKLGKNYKQTEKYETDKAANLYGQLQNDIKHGRIKVGDDDYYKYKTDIKNAQSNARQAANARHQLAVEELGDIQTRWENRSGTYGSKISMIETKASDTTRKATKNYSGLRSAYKQQSVYALNEASELQKKLGKAVKNGDIQKYSKAWYEWTENIKKAKENAEEYKKTIHELAVEEFNDIATKHDNKLNQITNQATKLNESIAQTQAKGYLVSMKYYEAQIKNEKKNNAELVSKKNELSIKLQTAIASGDIKVGSQAWYELTDEIEKTDIAIQQSTTSLIEFNNSIRDIKWQIFDLIQEKISQITQESDFLIKLMQNDKLYKEEGQGAGQLTNNGKATMGLHGVNYNTYMAQADKYAKEIIKIDKQLAKDPYNQDLAERREELLKLQQQMILSAEDEKQAIVDMVKEGIELELNALQNLIDKYNEALDSQKDLYDYQKKIKDQTKEITSLQKQLAAYTGDTSEETKSKVQQIKVSLEEAKENLEETQYDKFVSDQKKLLDDLYNEYEKVLNERLDDVDSLISDMIVNINEDANVIKDTLIEQASDVGYKISSTMNDIWKNGAQPVLSEYGVNFTNASTNVINAINSLTNSINTMVSKLDKEANNDTNVKNTNSKSATKKTNSKSATKTNTSNTSATKTTKTNSTKTNTSNTSATKTTKTNSTTKKRTTKENYGVALAIWNGNYGWGTGTTRTKRLKKKGFNANTVQNIVNKMGEDGYIDSDAWIGKYYGISDLSPYHYNKYKQGQYSINHNQMAWTNENGNSEVIIRRSDGAILTPLAKDDMILSSQATDNLFSIATDPNTFIKESLFGGQNNAGTANINNVNNNCSVSVDTINFNLPNVKNYEDFFYAAQHDKRFEKMVQAMTVDKLFGGSSLKKYRV